MRLDKFLADTGRFTRKEASGIIRGGFVFVDGIVQKSPQTHIAPEVQTVFYKNEKIEYRRFIYLMMNKPKDVVSASDDPLERTVISLLPETFARLGLFPCGRLDKDTTGLVILTNDGEGAHFLLSPKRHVQKKYYFEAADPLSEEDIRLLQAGVVLADGYVTQPCDIALAEDKSSGIITLTEGKYHQIKRMLGAVHNKITALERISFGTIQLDRSLLPGSWRYLLPEEEKLFLEAGARAQKK